MVKASFNRLVNRDASLSSSDVRGGFSISMAFPVSHKRFGSFSAIW